jgi:Fe-S cluster assembly protein SufB
MAQASIDLHQLTQREYPYGFATELEADAAPRGLNEDVIRLISAKKGEPAFLLDWRLRAYRHWRTLREPTWSSVRYPPIDYQSIVYYSAPKAKGAGPQSMAEVDPALRAMFDKLGISLAEQERLSGVALDAVVDSVSVATSFQAKLAELGIIFCSKRHASTPSWCASTWARWCR